MTYDYNFRDQFGNPQKSGAVSDLNGFLKTRPKCIEILYNILPREKGVSIDDLFKFVDVREHPGIKDKTLKELGGDSDARLGDVMAGAVVAYTLYANSTIFLNDAHFAHDPQERGATVFHEIVSHGIRDFNHVQAATFLHISVPEPPLPPSKLGPYANSKARDAEMVTRRLLQDRLRDANASVAIDNWINRGCQ